jgi:phage gp45-like
MSGPTTKELAAVTDPFRRFVRSMIRRMVTSDTRHAIWQLVGVRDADGRDEVRTVELFPGVGIAARPPSGRKAEVIVAHAGGAESPAIVATREEKTAAEARKAIGGLAAGETVIYASGTTYIVLRADGTIEVRNAAATIVVNPDATVEVRTPAGVARKLAFHDELEALRDYVHNQFKASAGHIHALAVAGAGGVTTTIAASNGAGGTAPSEPVPVPVGTVVLKGE